MGYSTYFEGCFEFKKTPAPEVVKAINALFNECGDGDIQKLIPKGTKAPSCWSPWEVSEESSWDWKANKTHVRFVMKGCDALIEYNHNDSYVEWLVFILMNFAIPNNLILNGTVKWIGEDINDQGLMILKNNRLSVKVYKGRYLCQQEDDSPSDAMPKDFKPVRNRCVTAYNDSLRSDGKKPAKAKKVSRKTRDEAKKKSCAKAQKAELEALESMDSLSPDEFVRMLLMQDGFDVSEYDGLPDEEKEAIKAKLFGSLN